MNRTQKGALVNLVGALINISVVVFLVVEIVVLKRLPGSFFEKFWVPIAVCVISPILFIFYRRKQNPAEVEADERDKLIKKRAVLVSFVLVWILLAALTLSVQLVAGAEGSIPVWFFSIINVCMLLVVFLIYSVAVLIQYGWGGKGEENHE